MTIKKDNTILGYNVDSVKSNTVAYCKKDNDSTENTPISTSPFWSAIYAGCEKVIANTELMKQI